MTYLEIASENNEMITLQLIDENNMFHTIHFINGEENISKTELKEIIENEKLFLIAESGYGNSPLLNIVSAYDAYSALEWHIENEKIQDDELHYVGTPVEIEFKDKESKLS